jgi:hypothetical protein
MSADSDPRDRLASLDRGFRRRFLDFASLTAQLEAWAAAFPDLVTLEAIGHSREGRPLWLLTIDREPDRRRPAVWVDGNMHASELAGSSVALAIAEDVLRLHLAPGDPTAGDAPSDGDDDDGGKGPDGRADAGDDAPKGAASEHPLPPALLAFLREVPVHVLPRVSPDGAERVLVEGPFVRSVPDDPRDRPAQERPRWVPGDLDGDGLALLMRVEDPTGEYVEAPERPGLLVPRRLGDPGPTYKVYGEGHIDGFEGHRVPDPSFLDAGQPDLNRNFPFRWAPEPAQAGAGSHPTSRPESRAVVEWASAHPNLFVWMNLHTFGGVFIRPLGDARDTAMDPEDLAIWRELGAEAEAITGYPMVSGFEEFTYVPETPIHGTLTEWAWGHRGCFAFVCELWDLFRQVGLEEKRRFVDHYSELTREDMLRIAAWDEAHNEGRVLRPWRVVDHPQLGRVEVGGLDPRVGLWNPPPESLPGICRGLSRFFLRLAARLPRVQAFATADTVAEGVFRVRVEVENTGYFSTRGPAAAKDLPHVEPLRLTATPRDGAELVDPSEGRQELGHLDGWGRGRFGGAETLYLLRSRGTTGRATAAITVRGPGTLSVRIGSPRVGHQELTLPLGPVEPNG